MEFPIIRLSPASLSFSFSPSLPLSLFSIFVLSVFLFLTFPVFFSVFFSLSYSFPLCFSLFLLFIILSLCFSLSLSLFLARSLFFFALVPRWSAIVDKSVSRDPARKPIAPDRIGVSYADGKCVSVHWIEVARAGESVNFRDVGHSSTGSCLARAQLQRRDSLFLAATTRIIIIARGNTRII